MVIHLATLYDGLFCTIKVWAIEQIVEQQKPVTMEICVFVRGNRALKQKDEGIASSSNLIMLFGFYV